MWIPETSLLPSHVVVDLIDEELLIGARASELTHYFFILQHQVLLRGGVDLFNLQDGCLAPGEWQLPIDQGVS